MLMNQTKALLFNEGQFKSLFCGKTSYKTGTGLNEKNKRNL